MQIKYVEQLGAPRRDAVAQVGGYIDDLNAAKRFGTIDLNTYSTWAWKSCAAACVLMVLKSASLYEDTLFALVNELMEIDGYLVGVGWKHAALVQVLQKYGVTSEIERQLTRERVEQLLQQRNLIILSVKSRITEGGGHMVLLHQLENGTVTLYDPYNLDNKGGINKVNLSDIEEISNHKGISIAPFQEA